MNLADIESIQKDLKQLRIDAWLLVNHHGMDPIAVELLGLDPARKASRRWWYYIPQAGPPAKLEHLVEPDALAHLPGTTERYASQRSLTEQLGRWLTPGQRVGMQYSPGAQLPMVSLVDAGTVELIRSFGVSVVSSAELLQRHYSQLSDAQMASHARATELIHGIKDEAFELIRRRTLAGERLTDLDVQHHVVQRFNEVGMTCDGNPPIVAINENAANPHFAIRSDRPVPVAVGDRVLLDLWARMKGERTVYADICWCAFVGAEPPAAYARLFGIAVRARDAAVGFLEERLAKRALVTGAEVDRAARAVFEQEGVAQLSVHRTGHSIDTSVHGRGANIDGYETNDLRPILPRTCFSIEPALYDIPMGVRTEINVMVDAGNSPRVFGAQQTCLTCLGTHSDR